MSVGTDWRPLCDDAAFYVSGRRIRVTLDRGRRHWVRVATEADGWTLSGLSADEATLRAAGVATADLWSRNRMMSMVGYSVASDGTASVTAWLPAVGTTAAEFSFLVREVAVEADRLEYACNGQDFF